MKSLRVIIQLKVIYLPSPLFEVDCKLKTEPAPEGRGAKINSTACLRISNIQICLQK